MTRVPKEPFACFSGERGGTGDRGGTGGGAVETDGLGALEVLADDPVPLPVAWLLVALLLVPDLICSQACHVNVDSAGFRLDRGEVVGTSLANLAYVSAADVAGARFGAGRVEKPGGRGGGG